MVKKGKKKWKKGGSLEEVLGTASKDGEWQTGSAMAVDAEAGAPAEQGATDMDTTEGPTAKASKKATSHVKGLGVVVHSMKRGDHTAKQKKRKIKKIVKAAARADRVGVRVERKETQKAKKVARKNIY